MEDAAAWNGNWAWSLPLIVLTVIIHVIGLGFINAKVIETLAIKKDNRFYVYFFASVLALVTILATCLHAIEASIWAAAYRVLGALPDNKTALLYSLSAITSYGHSEIYLALHWRLMGALEALNGLILFGLTTAFMYGTIQRVWPVESRGWHLPGFGWYRPKSDPKSS